MYKDGVGPAERGILIAFGLLGGPSDRSLADTGIFVSQRFSCLNDFLLIKRPVCAKRRCGLD